MNGQLLVALVAFALVTSVTPEPNNVMVLTSAVNFGFRRTVPHLVGIAVGVVVLIAAIGLGLGGLLTAYPALYDVLRWVACAYLIYLAWTIARSGALKSGSSGPRPLGFLRAAAFQWANPKAWVMALGAVTAYAPREGYLQNVLLVAVIVGAVCVPSVTVWAAGGTALRRFLTDPRRLRIFNVTMAALLLLSLYPVLVDARNS